MTRSAMLIPKPHVRRAVGEMPEPATVRRLLRYMADNADLLGVDGRPFLLIEMTPAMLDALAEFEAELEDLEPAPDDEAEPDIEDDDPPEDADPAEIGGEHDLAALGRLQEQRYRRDVKRLLGIDLGSSGAIALRPTGSGWEPYPVEGVPR